MFPIRTAATGVLLPGVLLALFEGSLLVLTGFGASDVTALDLGIALAFSVGPYLLFFESVDVLDEPPECRHT